MNFNINPNPEEGNQEQNQEEEQNILSLYKSNAVNILQSCKLTEATDIQPLKPLLRYIDGVSGRASDFLCRGTLTMVTGQKGCRKSTFVRALVNILLNRKLTGNTPDTITAKANGLKVAIIDTEQHPNRVNNTRKALLKACPTASERLQVYSARGLNADGLRDLLLTLCEVERPDVVFLDVVSHFVDDINDQRGAKILLDYLNNIMERYDVAIIGVIHQNPNPQASAADKMAGALGTKLWHASECVLHVARMGETMQRVNDKGEPQENLFGKGSIITFAEYRERFPDIMTIAIFNENERGKYELSIHPARVEVKQEKAFSAKIPKCYLIPSDNVSKIARDVIREEQKNAEPVLQFEPLPKTDNLPF